MSMITATAWVPRGFAAQFPTKYEFNEEEFSRITKLAQQQLEDAQEDLAEARQDGAPSAKKSNGAGKEEVDEGDDDEGAVNHTNEYVYTLRTFGDSP